MAIKLKIVLVRSGINRPSRQKATLEALGLKKLNSCRVLVDNLSVRGMVRKVSHLVTVESFE
jgi:large subunit ribosomal protein L30